MRKYWGNSGRTSTDISRICSARECGSFIHLLTFDRRYFSHHKPARTTIEASLQGKLAGIDVVAYFGMPRD
jgi:hypothetical protein